MSIENALWYKIEKDENDIENVMNTKELIKSNDGFYEIFDLNGNFIGKLFLTSNFCISLKNEGYKNGIYFICNITSHLITKVSVK